MGRPPASRAATAIRPVGWMPRVNDAVRIASAAGVSRPRRDGPFDQYVGDQCPGGDLSLGAQAVVERHPGRQQHQAGRPQRRATARHSRSQPRQHLAGEQQPADQRADQIGQPDPQARRADVGHQRQHVVVPAERILRHAEPAEVVRHVAGAVGDPGHAQDVAVVGGVGAHHVPDQEGAHHRHVDGGEGPPARGDQPVHTTSVEPVQTPQACHSDDGRGDRQQHGGKFQCRRPGGEPGVDGRRHTESGRRRAGQIGEHPHDGRTEVRVLEPAAPVVVTLLRRLVVLILDGGGVRRNADETGEGTRFRRGDLDTLATRRLHLRPRHTCHHDVAVGDIDARRVHRDEQ